MKTTLAICALALLAGCVDDGTHDLSETQDAVTATNRLAANRLAANRLAANRLAANRLAANSLETQGLMSTEGGRELMTYIVGCAIPTGTSLTLQDPTGGQYTYDGWIGLAPAWATRAPTVTERRWVTACLLSRTNVNGVLVNISMRSDTNTALLTSATERATYTQAEGAFYGDLFAPVPVTYACSNRGWTSLVGTFRACALSSNGLVTDCGFTYTGACTTACTDKVAPFGGCKAAGVTYGEAITINLTPSQQAGSPQ
jgi:hypothetical protein